MGSQGDSRGQGKMGNFSLARQASIYSLTLEEFQNTLGGPSKNFGSMNMDEFLKNIWTAEESQAMAAALGSDDGELGRQASLQRQGSLTIPRTLSRKTVDEVWRDINKETPGAQSNGVNPPARQITYGEMTLEDFLVRAGVVREENIMNTNLNNTTISVSSNHFGGFNQFERVDNRAVGAANGLALDLSDRGTNVEIKNSVSSSTLPMAAAVNSSLAGEVKLDSMDAFKVSHAQTDWFGNTHRSPVSHQQQQATDAVAVYPSSVKRQTEGALMGSGFPGAGGVGLSPRMNATAAAAAMMANGCHVGMGGMGMPAALGTAALNVQPVTPPAGQLQMDPMSLSHGDGSPVVPYGLDGTLRGRRGGVSVEKIVERRQRRMIKNRESAARSRARKQAYTVELEAEVSQLKEENKELRQKQEEMAESRKRQFMEIMSSLSQNLRNKPKLRRTQTGPW